MFSFLCFQPLQYQYRGAELALTAMARHFGPQLFAALPLLWTHISQPWQNLPVPKEGEEGMCVYECACVVCVCV